MWFVFPQVGSDRLVRPTTPISWRGFVTLIVLSAGVGAARGGLVAAIVAIWLALYSNELYVYANVYTDFVLLPLRSEVLLATLVALAGAIPVGAIGFVVGVASRRLVSRYTG